MTNKYENDVYTHTNSFNISYRQKNTLPILTFLINKKISNTETTYKHKKTNTRYEFDTQIQ